MNDIEDYYTKALMGNQATKAGFNYVVQQTGKANQATIIGNTAFASEMSFGASPNAPHVLVLCDVIIRPHLVIQSEHLLGTGIAGIAKDGIANADSWLKHGKIIINNMPSQ